MKILNPTRMFAAASLVAVGMASAAAAETLRVAHSSNPGQSVYIYWEELANRVNERSDGELELKVFPSGQLGGDEQILRGMGSGTIHMGSNASSNMSIVSDAYSWSVSVVRTFGTTRGVN